VASHNILFSMFFIPIFYVIYGIIAGVFIAKLDIIPAPRWVQGLIWFATTLVVISLMSWQMLRFWDAVKKRAKNIKALWRMTFQFNQATIAGFQGKRRALQRDIRGAVGRLAPPYYQSEHPLMKQIFEKIQAEEKLIAENNDELPPSPGLLAKDSSMQAAR